MNKLKIAKITVSASEILGPSIDKRKKIVLSGLVIGESKGYKTIWVSVGANSSAVTNALNGLNMRTKKAGTSKKVISVNVKEDNPSISYVEKDSKTSVRDNMMAMLK